jgi:hypothetical protein
VIYGPRYAKLSDKLFRVFMARPANEYLPPDFRVRAMPHSFERVGVSTGNISLPGRAAGWAALQLYLNRRNIFMDQLHLLDDGIVGGATSFARFTNHPTPSTTTPIEMWLHGCMPNLQTGIRVKNEGGKTLNNMLETLHTEYRVLEPGTECDAMLGRIVGARSLDEFHGAWDRAWVRETPEKSARALLGSDVFISGRAAGD